MNPFELSPEQAHALWLNIPAMVANGSLERIATNSPTMETLIHLVRAASESRKEADRTIAAIAAKQMESQLKGA